MAKLDLFIYLFFKINQTVDKATQKTLLQLNTRITLECIVGKDFKVNKLSQDSNCTISLQIFRQTNCFKESRVFA